MKGWIKLHRKLLKNAISTDMEFLGFWAYLLLNANHKDRNIIVNKEMQTIKRGSFLSSQRKIARNTDLSLTKVHRMLNKLNEWGYIKHQTTQYYTVISINNWDKYQNLKHQRNTDKTQTKHRRKTDEKLTKTNKNDKNINNDKNVKKYIDSILKKWKSKKHLPNHTKNNKSIKNAIAEYITTDEQFNSLLVAIDNYYEAYEDKDYFYNNIWKLDKFISQSNGYYKWVDGGEYQEKYKKHKEEDPSNKYKEMLNW